MKPSSPLLTLHIQLVGSSSPEIFRVIAMPAAASFYDLHQAIQYAFGWKNAHLHEFSEVVLKVPLKGKRSEFDAGTPSTLITDPAFVMDDFFNDD
ncbi:MAG TPA: hypothetical protein VK907_08025, partial [Phnomibacter sp.]|nr:hypothetical protein [Phnomibacter sp.]